MGLINVEMVRGEWITISNPSKAPVGVDVEQISDNEYRYWKSVEVSEDKGSVKKDDSQSYIPTSINPSEKVIAQWSGSPTQESTFQIKTLQGTKSIKGQITKIEEIKGLTESKKIYYRDSGGELQKGYITNEEAKKIAGDAGWNKESVGSQKASASFGSGTWFLDNLKAAGMGFGLGYMIGGLIGDNADIALGSAMAVTSLVWNAEEDSFIGKVGKFFGGKGLGIDSGLAQGIGGVVIGTIIFALMYEKESTETVEFGCMPYEPPIGGGDCELCNDDDLLQCSEYRCKSLGQACELLNAGTENEACAWVNPHDVNSPLIKISDLLKGYIYKPDTAVRPPATGVVITQENGACVEAFTPLEFNIMTNEPAQCKIDYNLTTSYEDMSYYTGGTNLYSYNHTETMSLPGPDAINKVAPELKNDGTYTLYVRCRDANGNFNQDPFSVRFCVNPGPDTTPPKIVDVNMPSGTPVLFNSSTIDIEVYVNEPSECKWSRENRDFDNMETEMECQTNLWEMNNQQVYTCKTTLTGIENRKENDYYFRCKDQPGAEEGDRNVNNQGYKYTLFGTQPLNIFR